MAGEQKFTIISKKKAEPSERAFYKVGCTLFWEALVPVASVTGTPGCAAMEGIGAF